MRRVHGHNEKQWYPLKGMMCTHKLHRQGVSEEETINPTMCYMDLNIEPEGGVATGVPIQQDDQDADAEDGAELGSEAEGLANPFAPLQPQVGSITG
jgi:hypothetical protein